LEAAKRDNSHGKRAKAPKFCTIEKQLFGEFTEARLARPNLPIDGSWLKIRAQRIAADQKIVDFKRSDIWLAGFKSRFGLATKQSCCESSKVDQMDIDHWLETSKETLLKILLTLTKQDYFLN